MTLNFQLAVMEDSEGESQTLSNKLKKHAKQVGKRMIILHRHPLITSGRKLDLYGKRAHLRLIVKTVLRPKATLTNKAECELWYDGRR